MLSVVVPFSSVLVCFSISTWTGTCARNGVEGEREKGERVREGREGEKRERERERERERGRKGAPHLTIEIDVSLSLSFCYLQFPSFSLFLLSLFSSAISLCLLLFCSLIFFPSSPLFIS
jgi:hypothetical protein